MGTFQIRSDAASSNALSNPSQVAQMQKFGVTSPWTAFVNNVEAGYEGSRGFTQSVLDRYQGILNRDTHQITGQEIMNRYPDVTGLKGEDLYPVQAIPHLRRSAERQRNAQMLSQGTSNFEWQSMAGSLVGGLGGGTVGDPLGLVATMGLLRGYSAVGALSQTALKSSAPSFYAGLATRASAVRSASPIMKLLDRPGVSGAMSRAYTVGALEEASAAPLYVEGGSQIGQEYTAEDFVVDTLVGGFLETASGVTFRTLDTKGGFYAIGGEVHTRLNHAEAAVKDLQQLKASLTEPQLELDPQVALTEPQLELDPQVALTEPQLELDTQVALTAPVEEPVTATAAPVEEPVSIIDLPQEGERFITPEGDLKSVSLPESIIEATSLEEQQILTSVDPEEVSSALVYSVEDTITSAVLMAADPSPDPTAAALLDNTIGTLDDLLQETLGGLEGKYAPLFEIQNTALTDALGAVQQMGKAADVQGLIDATKKLEAAVASYTGSMNNAKSTEQGGLRKTSKQRIASLEEALGRKFTDSELALIEDAIIGLNPDSRAFLNTLKPEGMSNEAFRQRLSRFRKAVNKDLAEQAGESPVDPRVAEFLEALQKALPDVTRALNNNDVGLLASALEALDSVFHGMAEHYAQSSTESIKRLLRAIDTGDAVKVAASIKSAVLKQIEKRMEALRKAAQEDVAAFRALADETDTEVDAALLDFDSKSTAQADFNSVMTKTIEEVSTRVDTYMKLKDRFPDTSFMKQDDAIQRYSEILAEMKMYEDPKTTKERLLDTLACFMGGG